MALHCLSSLSSCCRIFEISKNSIYFADRTHSFLHQSCSFPADTGNMHWNPRSCGNVFSLCTILSSFSRTSRCLANLVSNAFYDVYLSFCLSRSIADISFFARIHAYQRGGQFSSLHTLLVLVQLPLLQGLENNIDADTQSVWIFHGEMRSPSFSLRYP